MTSRNFQCSIQSYDRWSTKTVEPLFISPWIAQSNGYWCGREQARVAVVDWSPSKIWFPIVLILFSDRYFFSWQRKSDLKVTQIHYLKSCGQLTTPPWRWLNHYSHRFRFSPLFFWWWLFYRFLALSSYSAIFSLYACCIKSWAIIRSFCCWCPTACRRWSTFLCNCLTTTGVSFCLRRSPFVSFTISSIIICLPFTSY